MIYYLLGSSRFCTIWNERENGLVTVRYTDGSISLGDFNRNLLIKTNMELKPPKVQTYLQPTLTKMLKKATNRFLGWKLPDTFNPDGGISYDHRGDVIGTHLFTAQEAELMVRYILEDSTLVELIKDARKQLLDEIMEELPKKKIEREDEQYPYFGRVIGYNICVQEVKEIIKRKY